MTGLAAEYTRLYEQIAELRTALRLIANRAGAPTMQYSPEMERIEQRASLNVVADIARKALEK
jgi:hypothetical protein